MNIIFYTNYLIRYCIFSQQEKTSPINFPLNYLRQDKKLYTFLVSIHEESF
jgi:hypothetical protein